MKGQEDVHIIQLPLDNVMSMTHKGKGKQGWDLEKIRSKFKFDDC